MKLSQQEFDKLMERTSKQGKVEPSKDVDTSAPIVQQKDPVLEQLEMLNFSISEMAKNNSGDNNVLLGISMISTQLAEIKTILQAPKKYVMNVERNQEKLIKRVEILENYGSV